MTENCVLSRPRRSNLEAPHDDAVAEPDALRAEVAELRASRERLALAADAERRDIERALHAGVQQLLVGLAANLELAAASMGDDLVAARKLLDEVAGDVQLALEEARRLAQRIYPPLLEMGGLAVALRSAASETDVPIRIDVPADLSLPSEVAGAVFFCCLDVLERVDAMTPTTVTARAEGGALSFQVAVEGDVDVDLPSRDRVEALGGRLTIRRGPGHETRVAGSLPIPG
jgi:signal transduction histidine kinase